MFELRVEGTGNLNEWNKVKGGNSKKVENPKSMY